MSTFENIWFDFKHYLHNHIAPFAMIRICIKYESYIIPLNPTLSHIYSFDGQTISSNFALSNLS